MLNVDNLREAEQRRLTWRCRRGMLELDIVLQRFMAQHFNNLSLDELSAFDVMLELPDNDFWDMLQLTCQQLKSKEQQSIIDKINGLKGL